MGIREALRKKKIAYLKSRQEVKGYRKIVGERVKLASRQVYADEIEKVAREKARAKARAPSFGQKLAMVSQRIGQPRKKRRSKVIRTKRKRYTSTKPTQAPVQRAPMGLNQAIYGGY